MIYISIVIVIIIIIVCWGKISLDALNNKPQISLLKTLIYLFLAVIVCIIYYKTTVVCPINSGVNISKFKGLVDKNGKNIDGAFVTINHRMHNHSIRDSLLHMDYRANGGFRIWISPNTDPHFNKYSQYDSTKLIPLFNIMDELYSLKKNKNIPDSNITQKFIDKFANEYLEKGFRDILNNETNLDIISNTNIKKIEDFYDYALSDINRLYKISISTNKYPSFLPYNKIEDCDSRVMNTSKGILCYYQKNYSNYLYIPVKNKTITDEKILKELNLWNLPNYTYYVAESKGIKGSHLEVETEESDINHIDYFTASDISQASFVANFNSDIPLKCILILFDEPIDITSITPVPDEVDLCSILYTDSIKLEKIRRSPIEFHTKFPRYENKQIVRSLVLTTILVGVVSLFCINFFILIRGLYNSLISDEIVKRQKKLLKHSIYILKWQSFLIILWIFVLYIKYAFGHTIVISKNDEASILNSAIFFITIISCIALVSILIILIIYLTQKFKTLYK